MLRILTVFMLIALSAAGGIRFGVEGDTGRPYNSSCMALTCQKSGASCTGDFFLKNETFCFSQAMDYKQPTGCCPIGLFCLTTGNSSSFTCMKDNSGASCSSNGDCIPSFYGSGYATCQSGKCQLVYGAGDACSADSDCYSGTCSGSICTGLSVGEECTTSPGQFSICDTNLWCKLNATSGMSHCANTLTSTDSCEPVSEGTPCPAGYWCTGNKCTAVGTVASGGNCSSSMVNTKDTVNTYLCASGLAANVSSGKCVTGKEWMLTSCTNDTDCSSIGEDSKCDCNANGKGYCSEVHNVTEAPDSTGVSQGVALLQCLAKYNCSYDYLSPDGMTYANNDPNSCSVKNCNSYLKKFMSSGCDMMKPAGSCYYMPYCSGFPIWAIIVIVVVAILLVLAVVFVIFLVLRKRRDYSSI